MPFSGQNGPVVLNKFFGTNHYYYFHLPVGPFHYAKFAKNSYSRSKVVRMPQAQNGPFATNNYFYFFYQYDFHLTISPSHYAKFQKNPSSRSRVMRMRNFWASAQMRIFQKACYWTLFLSFLCTCQKSKWDINVLVKCSWLKKTGISLMESHF